MNRFIMIILLSISSLYFLSCTKNSQHFHGKWYSKIENNGEVVYWEFWFKDDTVAVFNSKNGIRGSFFTKYNDDSLFFFVMDSENNVLNYFNGKILKIRKNEIKINESNDIFIFRKIKNEQKFNLDFITNRTKNYKEFNERQKKIKF